MPRPSAPRGIVALPGRNLLASANGFDGREVEGFAIDAAGTGWVVTDNDGVQDASGETLFWSIGSMN